MNIYVARSGQRMGPYSEHEVRLMVKDGRALASDPGWREGLVEWRPLYEILHMAPPMPPPLPVAQGAPAQSGSPIGGGAVGSAAAVAPVYFYISAGRLALMTFVSMGLFQAYWIYRNWRNIQQRDGSPMQPVLRGIFGVFFIRPLLDAIKTDPVANRIRPARFSVETLATAWIAMVIAGIAAGRLSDPVESLVGLAIALLSVCCLVTVQDYVNAVVEGADTGRRHDEWSAGQILCGAAGLVLWGLMVVGVSESKLAVWRPREASTPAPFKLSFKPELLPKGPAFANEVKASFVRAVALYPEAGVGSSPLFHAVEARREQLARKKPEFFYNARWPELLILEVAESMGFRNTMVKAALETMAANSSARNVRDLGAFMETIHPLCPEYGNTQETMEGFFKEGRYRFSMSDVVLMHEDETEIRVSCRTRYWREDGSGGEIRRKMRYVLHPWMGKWKIYRFEVLAGS